MGRITGIEPVPSQSYRDGVRVQALSDIADRIVSRRWILLCCQREQGYEAEVSFAVVEDVVGAGRCDVCCSDWTLTMGTIFRRSGSAGQVTRIVRCVDLAWAEVFQKFPVILRREPSGRYGAVDRGRCGQTRRRKLPSQGGARCSGLPFSTPFVRPGTGGSETALVAMTRFGIRDSSALRNEFFR